MKKLTYQCTCAEACCLSDGFSEYCGFCAKHWSQLSANTRSLLSGEPENATPVIHQTHQHIHPPQSRLVTFIVGLAGGGSALGLVKLASLWMTWKSGR